MTDEQIKQNAEAYAEQNKVNFSEDKNFEIYDYDEQKDAYIAGAHSRDVEIEELKKKLEDMTKLKNFFASSLDIYDKDNKELQEQLKMNVENMHKLQNPWHKTDDEIPKEGV